MLFAAPELSCGFPPSHNCTTYTANRLYLCSEALPSLPFIFPSLHQLCVFFIKKTICGFSYLIKHALPFYENGPYRECINIAESSQKLAVFLRSTYLYGHCSLSELVVCSAYYPISRCHATSYWRYLFLQHAHFPCCLSRLCKVINVNTSKMLHCFLLDF